MKYLVLGCNGMAGHIILKYLINQGHEVKGFARTSSFITSDVIIGDALNRKILKEVIQNSDYDVIINCIGILNSNAEKNPLLAIEINSYLPHFLADLTKNQKTKIIHLSTDCVFSGKKGDYHVHDIKDGETFYDRTKALGELEDSKNLTLRGSIIGPDINPNGIGLMNWFLLSEQEITGFQKAIWTGQTTLQLAKTIEAMSPLEITGIYHTVPNESISKYDLLLLMNQYLPSRGINISADTDFTSNKSLLSCTLPNNIEIPNYETMMQEMGDWIEENSDLYPHYF